MIRAGSVESVAVCRVSMSQIARDHSSRTLNELRIGSD